MWKGPVRAESIVFLVIVASLLARYAATTDLPLTGFALNDDALSHVLVTTEAYAQTPMREHTFLPLFTLGARHDKFIDDLPTASLTDAAGNTYYTSFPPPLFIAAYIGRAVLQPFMEVIGRTREQAAIDALRLLSVLLGTGAAGLFYYLASICTSEIIAASDTGAPSIRGTAEAGALAALVFFVSSFEFFKSYSLNIWAQHFHLIIILLLVIFFVRGWLLALCLLNVLSVMFEWTGFVTAGGLVLAALWYWQSRGASWAIWIWLSTIAGAALIALWLGTKFPLDSVIHNLAHRSAARSGVGSQIALLLPGYILSLGLSLAVAVVLPMIARRHGRSFQGAMWSIIAMASRRAEPPTYVAAALFLMAFSCIENLLVAGHADSYSFDRLKVVMVLALLAGLLWSALDEKRISFLIVLFVIATIMNTLLIALPMRVYPEQFAYFRSMMAPFHAVPKDIDAVGYANFDVRGFDIYYAGRNIVSLPGGTPEGAQGLGAIADFARNDAAKRGFSTALLLYREPPFINVPPKARPFGQALGFIPAMARSLVQLLRGAPPRAVNRVETVFCIIPVRSVGAPVCKPVLLAAR